MKKTDGRLVPPKASPGTPSSGVPPTYPPAKPPLDIGLGNVARGSAGRGVSFAFRRPAPSPSLGLPLARTNLWREATSLAARCEVYEQHSC